MARKISSALFFLTLSFHSLSQSLFQEDFKFLHHLERLEEWNEGLLFLDELESRAFPADTLNFFRGKFQYKLKQSKSSISYLRKVSGSNIHYYRYARFFTAFQLAYDGFPVSSRSILQEFEPQDSLMIRLKNLQLAGLDLLDRNYESYTRRQQNFTFAYELEPYERGMLERYDELQGFKKKSRFTAALLSSLVPGAGRFYIGKPGAGIAALLVTGIFGLQAWEGYRKDGINSARFIVFGTLFSVSHIANVWGTALAVKVRREEFNDQMNESILLDMHIPLRVLLD